MMKLLQAQINAVNVLKEGVDQSSEIHFNVKIGHGRGFIVAEALRDKGPVCYVSTRQELLTQTMRINQELGVTNASYALRKLPEDADQFNVIVLDETTRRNEIDHRCVIRLNSY